ncbi:MAG: glycosyltransferase family 2 protein [Flavobacteriales bacterium]|nr:glycosyltransferase family 2 protein [Flavobacteriales bacterium]
MKVAGFTFIRNAVKYDYPVVEAITSVLPICDAFYVAVGNSDDETRALIEGIGDPRIHIIDTVWDDSLREGGRVLAVETDKALKAVPDEYYWRFYIQGDEVFHHDGLAKIKKAMEAYQDDRKVEGLLMHYRHFYGSYDYVGDSRKWYRNEVRVIRRDAEIYSFRDAQGFQKKGRPLRVALVEVWMHHYGWVKHPKLQQEKQRNFNKLWHTDDWVEKNQKPVDEFDYGNIDSLSRFEGSHPTSMQARIDQMNWSFSFDPTVKNLTPKRKFLHAIEDVTGWRIGEYKNFRIVRRFA